MIWFSAINVIDWLIDWLTCYVTWLRQRFQKAYESLEHEATLERKKLMAEHQRRIQDELARKKTEAMNR